MEDENKNNVDTQTTNTDVQKEQNVSNKNEDAKVKKTSLQKKEDGSITFKNQDELDGFIARMYAKGAKNAGQAEIQNQEVETQQNAEQAQNETAVDYTDKIALAMARAGVDIQKVERAARLVDISKILENGTLDSKKLDEEINAVISDFPELKNSKEEEKEEKGFKFGATQSNTNGEQKTKTVATKRWNRFN